MSHFTEVEAWGVSWRFVSRIRVDIDHLKKHRSAMSERYVALPHLWARSSTPDLTRFVPQRSAFK